MSAAFRRGGASLWNCSSLGGNSAGALGRAQRGVGSLRNGDRRAEREYCCCYCYIHAFCPTLFTFTLSLLLRSFMEHGPAWSLFPASRADRSHQSCCWCSL